MATTLILIEARFSKWPDEPGDQVLTSEGVVVVMTDTHSKPLFENLLHNIEPITSKLEERLPETINAEVVSGVIYSIPSCVQWLTNTFMFTRKKCELTSPAPEAEAFRWAKKLAVKTLDELKAAIFVSSTSLRMRPGQIL